MKKILPFFILLFLSFTSCIEIVEEITMHDDNSGNIYYHLETNGISRLLNNFSGLLDSSIENQIKEYVEELAIKMKGQKGIDSVKYKLDGNKDNFQLRFSFAKPENLNDAIYNLLGYEENIFSPKYIKVNNHNFQRKNFAPWIKKYLAKVEIDLPLMDIASMVTYKTIVHFPKKVKHFKGSNLEISDDRMKLTQRKKLTEVLENKTNVSIKSKQ
jgi:hypothetical protein